MEQKQIAFDLLTRLENSYPDICDQFDHDRKDLFDKIEQFLIDIAYPESVQN